LGAAVFVLAVCASVATVGRSPASTGASSPVGHPTATRSDAGTPCIDPDPITPRPVQPAVPGVSADGNIAESWSLDDAITVEPAAGAAPVISRQRALCTLLAASDIRGSGLLGDDLTLILGKVTVSDALVAAPDPDATTGTDGLVYGARTNNPCGSGALDGPYVRPIVVTVSVPWRLISRDPGGLFGTIALAVRTCDDVSEYEGAYATADGVVEFDVSRPIASCGTSNESVQTLYGPAAGDRLATTLTHAATGFVDFAPQGSAFAEQLPEF